VAPAVTQMHEKLMFDSPLTAHTFFRHNIRVVKITNKHTFQWVSQSNIIEITNMANLNHVMNQVLDVNH
jgi:hypothetical protein